MNCKKDDIAMVLAGKMGINSPNAGKIVTCLRFVGSSPTLNYVGNDLWEIDRQIQWSNRRDGSLSQHYLVPDSLLRPFPKHGDDEVDEMVKLVGPATKQKEKVGS